MRFGYKQIIPFLAAGAAAVAIAAAPSAMAEPAAVQQPPATTPVVVDAGVVSCIRPGKCMPEWKKQDQQQWQ